MKSIKQLLILVAVIAVILIAFQGWKAHEKEEAFKERERLEKEHIAEIRRNITSYVRAERSSYQYSNLGGIYGLSISVHNKTEYPIDKVVVKVSYLKPSGDTWKEKYVDFYLIDPYKVIENRVADEQRGVRIEYEIVSIKSKALELF
ncbi:MAG: hypothetical protein J7621_21830 [Niastella sp.]|nr:hypothetical protein [Niastella sp.]